MRTSQFWILLLGSTFVSILLIKQIFLSHDLFRKQRDLVDCQEIVSQGAGFENAWQKLAMEIYAGSSHDGVVQDPGLAQILKDENIGVQPKTSPAGSAPATTPSAPPAASKNSVVPPHSPAP